MRTIFELTFYLQSKWISKNLKMFWRIEPKFTPVVTLSFVQIFVITRLMLGLEMTWNAYLAILIFLVLLIFNYFLGVKKNRFHTNEKTLREIPKGKIRLARLVIWIVNIYLGFIFMYPIVSSFINLA